MAMEPVWGRARIVLARSVTVERIVARVPAPRPAPRRAARSPRWSCSPPRAESRGGAEGDSDSRGALETPEQRGRRDAAAARPHHHDRPWRRGRRGWRALREDRDLRPTLAGTHALHHRVAPGARAPHLDCFA